MSLNIRTLKMAKVVKVPKPIRVEKKTKVSAHLSGGRYGIISEGDVIKVHGRCLGYDPAKRKWKPVEGEIKILLDGSEIKKMRTNGTFKHVFQAPKRGEHVLEVRYLGTEPNYKLLRFKVLEKDERKRMVVVITVLYLCLILFILMFIFIILNIIKH